MYDIENTIYCNTIPWLYLNSVERIFLCCNLMLDNALINPFFIENIN
jgi:hypothetical protein